MYFDTHAHLNSDRYENSEELILKLKRKGLFKIIVPGYDLKTSQRALYLSEKYNFLFPALGIHPSETDKLTNAELTDFAKMAETEKYLAIGECGLDYYWQKDNKKQQICLFEFQLDLAVRFNKPVIIHMRDSAEDIYNILLKYQGRLKGVMHCYSGSYEMALRFIKLGFYISIAGPVTYKNSRELPLIVKNIDFSYLLIETDSPYLSPEPRRKDINIPDNIEFIAAKIAQIRGISLDEVVKKTYQNACKLFDVQ